MVQARGAAPSVAYRLRGFFNECFADRCVAVVSESFHARPPGPPRSAHRAGALGVVMGGPPPAPLRASRNCGFLVPNDPDLLHPIITSCSHIPRTVKTGLRVQSDGQRVNHLLAIHFLVLFFILFSFRRVCAMGI